jgi:hypothetical protein
VAKDRFVLRYTGDGPKPDADVAKVSELADVVDASSPRMLLVECEPEPLRNLVDALPGWVMGADRTYEVPDTRKKVVAPPD